MQWLLHKLHFHALQVTAVRPVTW